MHAWITKIIINSYIILCTPCTSDPLPPPNDITLSEVRLASALPELRFNWTKNMIRNCRASYTITSDCGDCPTSTPINTAVCINVPVNNHTCSFTVRTVACGSIDGTQSNSISVALQGTNIFHTYLNDHEIIKITVPDALSIDAVPVYSHKTGKLAGIKTIFMELVSEYNNNPCILQPARHPNELFSNVQNSNCLNA